MRRWRIVDLEKFVATIVIIALLIGMCSAINTIEDRAERQIEQIGWIEGR